MVAAVASASGVTPTPAASIASTRSRLAVQYSVIRRIPRPPPASRMEVPGCPTTTNPKQPNPAAKNATPKAAHDDDVAGKAYDSPPHAPSAHLPAPLQAPGRHLLRRHHPQVRHRHRRPATRHDRASTPTWPPLRPNDFLARPPPQPQRSSADARHHLDRRALPRRAPLHLPARISADLPHAVDRPEDHVRHAQPDLPPPPAHVTCVLRPQPRRPPGHPPHLRRRRAERNVHLRRARHLRRRLHARLHRRHHDAT